MLYDPVRWDFAERAHGVYDRLRTTDPVYWEASREEWVVTSHRAVKAALREPKLAPFDYPGVAMRVAADRGLQLPAATAVLEASLIFARGPGHALARRYLNRVLNDRPFAENLPVVEGLCREHFAQVAAAGGGDLVGDIARAVPMGLMGHLLGIPRSELAFLAEGMERALPLTFHPDTTIELLAEANSSAALTLDLVEELIRERRARPQSDGISRLLQVAPDEELVDDRAMAARVIFLFLVAVETTVTLLSGSMLTLLKAPGEAERWRTGAVSADTAVEELIRMESPVQLVPRDATSDVELGGHMIREGQRVSSILAAANRDPEVFPDPHRLDLGRQGTVHLAFGEGAHHCLGAAIARMEARIVLPEFLKLRKVNLMPAIRKVKLDFLTSFQSIPFSLS